MRLLMMALALTTGAVLEIEARGMPIDIAQASCSASVIAVGKLGEVSKSASRFDDGLYYHSGIISKAHFLKGGHDTKEDVPIVIAAKSQPSERKDSAGMARMSYQEGDSGIWFLSWAPDNEGFRVLLLERGIGPKLILEIKKKARKCEQKK